MDFQRRIIVTAAMDQELAHLKILLGRVQRPLRNREVSAQTSPYTSARGGSVANMQLLKTGIGVAKTAASLRRCLEQATTQLVFGIGFAGGLSPQLQAGDLVVARKIRRNSATVPASTDLLTVAEKVQLQGTAVHFGTFVTVDRILGDSVSKKLLAASLENLEVACVDMESSAIAEVCLERQIPFLIVRCVTDRADEDLPIDFSRCWKRDGEIDPKRVLFSAMGKPRALVRLWQLRKRSQCCAERLTRFVEEFLRMMESQAESQ